MYTAYGTFNTLPSTTPDIILLMLSTDQHVLDSHEFILGYQQKS